MPNYPLFDNPSPLAIVTLKYIFAPCSYVPKTWLKKNQTIGKICKVLLSTF